IKIADLIGCAGSVLIILFASAWIPLMGPLFRILTPLPFLYYATKLGLNQGIIVSLITLFIVGIIAKLAGFSHFISLSLEFCLIGLVISMIFRRQFTFGRTVFWGTVILMIISAAVMFVLSLSRGLMPIDMVQNYFQANIGENFLVYEDLGLEKEKVAQLRQLGKMLSDIIAKIYPALVIIGTGFIVWINVVISKPLFNLKGLKYPEYEKLDRWQAPDLMVWGVIFMGFALFIKVSAIRLIAINALIVMAVIYVYNGLAIVLFLFNKYNVPRWARFGIYALIIIQQMSLAILSLMGLFDQWIDFRRIHKKV
ncbi:MAG: DUF2232 domain-containing protein, partial [Deltaproteobacteria bacterium]|nr:DUF2232 domain-containing protein [Deltaproteobacteria bacterium]